jgi:hypothetical protein
MLIDPYFYLATPYSKYPDGLQAAFVEAAANAAVLIRRGLRVYSPIAHTHPIAAAGKIDPLDHKIWLPADAPFMAHAHGLIICKMDGWATSFGIRQEIDEFEVADKPIFMMEPGIFPAALERFLTP